MKTFILFAAVCVGIAVCRSYPDKNWRFENPLVHPEIEPHPRFRRGYYDFRTGKYVETGVVAEKVGLVNDRTRDQSNQYNFNRNDYSPNQYNRGGQPAQSSFRVEDYPRRGTNRNGMGKYDPGNREYISSYNP